jgi:heptosyltransferase-2
MFEVLIDSSLLPKIKHKFHSITIIWITDSPELLEHNPLIDLIFKNNEADLNKLAALDFDIALVVDKSLQASAILNKVNVDLVYGFVANSHTGAIEPATSAAFELWDLGLNNEKKFFINTKTELQLQAEALELPYHRDPYGVFLSETEKIEASQRKILWSSFAKKQVVGLNTGCGPLLPEKKLPLAKWREILSSVQNNELLMQTISWVLLGGPAEQHEHELLKSEFPFLNLSPVGSGLRDGLVSVAACDLLITGDSLGMHMGIGLKKYVIAWFGPSCAHEIDLYDRGEHILAATLPCSPCWKRSCNKDFKCNDSIEANAVIAALERGLDFLEQAPLILDFERAQSNTIVSCTTESSEMSHEFMSLLSELIL